MKPTLVILAAGLGRRFRGLKQVAAVGPHGATLMDYAVFDAIRAGFGRVVYVIRPDMAGAFRESLAPRYAGRIDVACAFQHDDDLPPELIAPPGRTKPWGTGHAVRAARHAVSDPLAVINADDFYGTSALRAAAQFLCEPGMSAKPAGAAPADAARGDAARADVARWGLVVYALRDTLPQRGAVARAVCECDADDNLLSIHEVLGIERDHADARVVHPGGRIERLAGDTTVSMNLWAFTPHVFDLLEREFVEFLQRRGRDPAAEFYLPAAIDRDIRSGAEHVRVLRSGQVWCGLTHRNDQPHVERLIARLTAQGEYPERLWE